jgi:hypothetical protein
LLSECYRPTFNYRSGALSAREIWRRFIKDFRFLPDCTSEPEALADLIQKIIYRQRGLKLKPVCSRHGVTMVLLGNLGYTFLTPTKKNTMQTVHQMGNAGKLYVARGLFRCPTPGCFFVASTESSVTIGGTEAD